MSRSKFSGFGADTLKFLRQLANNNNRDWFTENKTRYEQSVVDPAFKFISRMGDELQSISSHFEAISRKQGGSLMRVYRDTRFSKDKTPYKTNIGIQFRHEVGKDVHAPGYYVHIEPGNIFVGVGMWHPESGALRAIRERIAGKPDDWKKFKRKDHIAVMNFPPADISDAAFPQKLASAFKMASPYMEYLCKSVGVPF